MIDILEWLHPYVPGHSEENESPTKLLIGGDYLSFERYQGAQSAMQDARTPSAWVLLQNLKIFMTRQNG